MRIRFTGSGSEYFRIWIVNLLLIVATVGIYYPWARIRRLRYFASNTWVGNARFGEHALQFDANPGRMLRGYAIMAALFVAYLLAGNLSEIAGSIAFLLLLGGIPMLTWASLRFRLGSMRWRGVQFSFAGTLAGAYGAYLPLIIAAVVTSALSIVFTVSVAQGSQGLSVTIWLPLLIGLVMALAWLQCLFRLVRYRQDHLCFGKLQTRLELAPSRYVRLLLKAGLLTLGLFVAIAVILVALAMSLGSLQETLQRAGLDRRTMSPVFGFMLMITALLVGLCWQILVRAWLVAREQNLVWSHTQGRQFAFHSRLSVAAYVRRSLLNGVLLLLTLGLYQPFASIALARLRLDALSISMNGSPDDIVAETGTTPGVAGDAGADVFGVDIGL